MGHLSMPVVFGCSHTTLPTGASWVRSLKPGIVNSEGGLSDASNRGHIVVALVLGEHLVCRSEATSKPIRKSIRRSCNKKPDA